MNSGGGSPTIADSSPQPDRVHNRIGPASCIRTLLRLRFFGGNIQITYIVLFDIGCESWCENCQIPCVHQIVRNLHIFKSPLTTTMTSTAELDRLRVAVIDGRVDNVRYRQNELQKLHQALTKNAEKFRIAISQDGRGDTSSEVSAEAEAEYSRIMSAVREFYLSLNFKKLLHDEYLITNELDNLERRVGKGLVVIKPTTHTRLYSIVCPIAAAITAGNCVCLEVCASYLQIAFKHY